MQIDKETPDNGINIKFGADRTASSKKGEYRLVSQNSVNGEKKRLNGTTKRGRLIFSFYTCTRKTMLRYTGEIQKKSTKKCIYMRGSGERERESGNNGPLFRLAHSFFHVNLAGLVCVYT